MKQALYLLYINYKVDLFICLFEMWCNGGTITPNILLYYVLKINFSNCVNEQSAQKIVIKELVYLPKRLDKEYKLVDLVDL